jgi:pilus assembly protein Flp/PilA
VVVAGGSDRLAVPFLVGDFRQELDAAFCKRVASAVLHNHGAMRRKNESEEKVRMKMLLLKLAAKAQVLRETHGQDLIEYALVAGLIALAATAGMNSVAGSINNAFTNLGTALTNYT